MKKLHMLLVVTCLAATACQGPPRRANNPILAGEVPRCREMLLPSNEEYRRVAKQECDAAKTPEERKMSGGCAILHALKFCSSAVTQGRDLSPNPVETVID